MTYHAGIAPGLGLPPREPHVTCNGCDARVSCLRSSGMPYAWAQDGKAPPGWKLVRVEEPFSRKDYCHECKDKPQFLTDRAIRRRVSEKRDAGEIGRKK